MSKIELASFLLNLLWLCGCPSLHPCQRLGSRSCLFLSAHLQLVTHFLNSFLQTSVESFSPSLLPLSWFRPPSPLIWISVGSLPCLSIYPFHSPCRMQNDLFKPLQSWPYHSLAFNTFPSSPLSVKFLNRICKILTPRSLPPSSALVHPSLTELDQCGHTVYGK